MAEKTTEKIIKTESKAYGYNYASLTDIVRQGNELPKMKTGTEGEKEYVYYYDKDLNEWIRGAEIVVPQMKSMNAAQQYGSALTYARRYTTLMALSLTSGDDSNLETTEKVFDEPSKKDLANEFTRLYTNEEQSKILNNYKVLSANDLEVEILKKYINYKKYGGR